MSEKWTYDTTTLPNTVIVDDSTTDTIRLDDLSGTVDDGNIWWHTSANTPVFNITYQNNAPKYTDFVLPEARMPEKVYINGLLQSPGIMGSDADYTYNGTNCLTFAPHTLTPTRDSPIIFKINTGKDKIVVEYDGCMYHYTIDFVPGTNEQEKEICTTQLSQVKKGV